MSTSQVPFPVLNSLDIGKESRTGAIALLVYDHLLNLDLEVELVWKHRKLRPGFFLYIFNRFFPLIYFIFDEIPLTPSGIVSSKVCIIYLMLDDIVTLVITATVQAILQLRIYALYDRNKTMLAFLLVGCFLELAAMIVLVAVTMSHLERLPVVSTATGCWYTGLFTISALFWIPCLIFEPILLFLVARKALGTHARIPLVTQMARDSLLYFGLVFAELLTSTVIWARYPTKINIINPWTAVLPSILGSRVLLNMRKSVFRRRPVAPPTVTADYVLETFAPADAWSSSVTADSTVIKESEVSHRNLDS